MKIVATICSRKKDPSAGLMPAKNRYIGAHTPQVENIAKEADVPFYILSGVYGLISGDEPIPDYDHLFLEEEVPALSQKIAEQIQSAGITEVEFYTKDKEVWRPYIAALQKGCELAGIRFIPQITDTLL